MAVANHNAVNTKIGTQFNLFLDRIGFGTRYSPLRRFLIILNTLRKEKRR